ncbi:hypothetical protein LAZ67_14001988 [Cordylochernes scorpioides]|uniref:Reverse transcriptase/retrotransposon-derived protein RNase H-like domain-containing protein n=1 Tax=Cordylochernes scorpioides TaxID=51811 RepID=A0ABY6L6I8_9ARAC|nr:hypothetical protein LAZ67_14001988 [Cordylochernes scorpioides]
MGNCAEIFDFERRESSPFSGVKHKIVTSDNQPIKQRPYRVSPTKRRAIQSEVDKMIKMGIVQPSESPWLSPVVLVKKKDGSWRFCVNYRKLNWVTKKDVYPIPRTDNVSDSLTGAKFYSRMDLRTGYCQIEIDHGDRELLGAKTLSFYHRAESDNRKLGDVQSSLAVRSTFLRHMERLEKDLKCIQKAGLCPNLDKCRFGSKMAFGLGGRYTPRSWIFRGNYKFIDPKNTTDVRSFIGFCSYYRRFVRNFANKAKPLHELLKTILEQDESFQILKSALTTDPLLGHFKEESETHLHTDASGHGIGAVLIQISRRRGKANRLCIKNSQRCRKELFYDREKVFSRSMGYIQVQALFVWKTFYSSLRPPFSLIHVSNNGNKWIVVATDYLSRYAMTRAIPNESAEKDWQIHTPRELSSNLYITNIKINQRPVRDHTLIYVSLPSTDQRVNRKTQEDSRRHVVFQRNWDAVLPYVTFAYNTPQQETTGFSPYYIIHGRDVETPLDTILAYRENTSLDDYVECMVANAEDARQLAHLEHFTISRKRQISI